MGRYIAVVFILFAGIAARAQDLTYVTFSGGATLSSFSFKTDQGVIIKISDDGKVIEWGTEMESRYPNYMPGKLEAFTGRIDYYGSEADSVSKRKSEKHRNLSIDLLWSL